MHLKLSSLLPWEGLSKDQGNNLAAGTFCTLNTCCSETHWNWLVLKTHERGTALTRLGNMERFSYAFPDGMYLYLS